MTKKVMPGRKLMKQPVRKQMAGALAASLGMKKAQPYMLKKLMEKVKKY